MSEIDDREIIQQVVDTSSPQAFGELVGRDETVGITPLHSAALNGNLDAIRVLVAHGADLTVTDACWTKHTDRVGTTQESGES